MTRILVLLLLSAAAFAQSNPVAEVNKPRVQKVIRLNHADPHAMQELLRVFNADIRAVQPLRALSISATAETIAAIEEVIQKFDVPGAAPAKKSAELTFHIIAASKSGPNQAIPGMEAVVRNMQSTFGYTSFELVDVMQLRVLDESRGDVSSKADFRNPLGPLTFTLSVPRVRIAERGSTHSVQLGDLRFKILWPVKTKNYTQEGVEREYLGATDHQISTSLDIQAGQKVVVGKANLAGPDYTIFLVVSGKVVD